MKKKTNKKNKKKNLHSNLRKFEQKDALYFFVNTKNIKVSLFNNVPFNAAEY